MGFHQKAVAARSEFSTTSVAFVWVRSRVQHLAAVASLHSGVFVFCCLDFSWRSPHEEAVRRTPKKRLGILHEGYAAKRALNITIYRERGPLHHKVRKEINKTKNDTRKVVSSINSTRVGSYNSIVAQTPYHLQNKGTAVGLRK